MFLANAEILILPYASAEGRSLLSRLTSELLDEKWESFWGAAAFARESGNDSQLLSALAHFLARGGKVVMTVGADVFGSGSYGSDMEAVRTLLATFDAHERAKLFLYHEQGRTFHPKIYLFTGREEALVIVGSSNWTKGGLSENVEASVVLHLDLSVPEQQAALDELISVFEEYWMEAQ